MRSEKPGNVLIESATSTPYDLLYEGINLKEAIGNFGTRLIIPKIFLHGRQGKNEYSQKKRNQIEMA